MYENDNCKISCTLSNPLGKVSSEANLKIKSPPKLEKEVGDQICAQGETLKMKVPISGKGPFEFKLKKDGVALPEGVKFKVNENDGTVTLTLPNVDQADDDGRYLLEIANDAGVLSVPFKLRVKAPPGPPTGPIEVGSRILF